MGLSDIWDPSMASPVALLVSNWLRSMLAEARIMVMSTDEATSPPPSPVLASLSP